MSRVVASDSTDLFVKHGTDAGCEDDGKLSQGLADEIEASGQYFSERQEALLGYANVILNDHHLSEDIVQQTFVNTIGALRRGVEISSYSAWTHRCVHNLALNQLRRTKPDPMDDQEELEEFGTQANVDQPELALDAQEKLNALMTTIDTLPNHLRAAFLLAEVHGYNYREIADLMNRSVTSTAQILFRARAKVRKIYDKDVFGNFTPPIEFGLFAKAAFSVRLVQQKVLAKVSGVLQMGSTAGTPDQILPQLAANVIAAVVAAGLVVNPSPASDVNTASDSPVITPTQRLVTVNDTQAINGEIINEKTASNTDIREYLARPWRCIDGPGDGLQKAVPDRCKRIQRAQRACGSLAAFSRRGNCDRTGRKTNRLGKRKNKHLIRVAFKKKGPRHARHMTPRMTPPGINVNGGSFPPHKPKPPVQPPGPCQPFPQCTNTAPLGDQNSLEIPHLPINISPSIDRPAEPPQLIVPKPSEANAVDSQEPLAVGRPSLPGSRRSIGDTQTSPDDQLNVDPDGSPSEVVG